MQQWTTVKLGSERALSDRGSSAHFLLGVGPATAGREQEARVAELARALAPEVTAVRWCRQIHGRALASLAPEQGDVFRGTTCVGRCDGLLTAEPGVALVVWTADCVPVLLASDVAVAAVHAGWRGAAAGIVPAAVRRLELEHGVRPDRLEVVLGPAVETCHYPVGPEVVAALAAAGVPRGAWERAGRVDVRSYLAAQLAQLGVAPEQVRRVGGCTACSPELASYRRDGAAAGRQWSAVVLTN